MNLGTEIAYTYTKESELWNGGVQFEVCFVFLAASKSTIPMEFIWYDYYALIYLEMKIVTTYRLINIEI